MAMTSQLPFNSRPDILTSLVGIRLTGSMCEGQGWRGGGEECGDGCVWGRWLGLRSRCGGKVGTYKYPVLVWAPQSPNTAVYLYCCGAVGTAVGTAVLAHLWSFPVNISCLFANHILFPDTQHKWTRTCKK